MCMCLRCKVVSNITICSAEDELRATECDYHTLARKLYHRNIHVHVDDCFDHSKVKQVSVLLIMNGFPSTLLFKRMEQQSIVWSYLCAM